MENDDSVQQLEEWKSKYYQSVTDFEKQQQYDELLQRSLGRLALAAQGLDKDLDKQLKSLRQLLRGNANHYEIKNILELMEQAIAKMESSKDVNTSLNPNDIWIELFQALTLPRKFKPEKKALLKQLKSNQKNTVSAILPEILSLLNAVLKDSSQSSSSSKLGFHLFGLGKKNESDTENTPHSDTQGLSSEDPNDELESHIILIQLLERLSLPTDLSKKATQVRLKIEHGLDKEQLPNVIADIADIISELGSKVISDKIEYETFLKSLTSRLSELDEHIRNTSDDEVKAFEQREVISKNVEQEVEGLRAHVDEAGDLEQLKTSVTERLDTLNNHFESYRKSDVERLEKSREHIVQLTNHIKQIEQESTALKVSAEKARSLALKDALTGIWNRQALNEIMEKEYTRWLRYQNPLSIIIWDVDFFKRVNDTYGHAAGDKVLKTIAQIFNQATRDADFIGRFGGEEFMGVFPETRLEEALKLANKIREKVANSKFHYENKPVPITASAGLATFRPNDSIDDVFKRADKALYKAKETGRNKCLADDK
jgi:diguanylate cyclase